MGSPTIGNDLFEVLEKRHTTTPHTRSTRDAIVIQQAFGRTAAKALRLQKGKFEIDRRYRRKLKCLSCAFSSPFRRENSQKSPASIRDGFDYDHVGITQLGSRNFNESSCTHLIYLPSNSAPAELCEAEGLRFHQPQNPSGQIKIHGLATAFL